MRLHRYDDGSLVLEAFRAGRYEIKTASGRRTPFAVPELPDPLRVDGPWTVPFAPDAVPRNR